MLSQLRPAVVVLVLMTLITGVAYPLLMTGVAQVVMPYRANGSLLTSGERIVGSALIDQPFGSDRYFHGRPSAAGANGYDAAASSGSNLGPLSKKLLDRVAADVAKLKSEAAAAIPADAVTASASGLDPHVSPEFALRQVPRVAAARKANEANVRAIVEAQVDGASLGFIGEPRVNVLELNLALDAAAAVLPVATE